MLLGLYSDIQWLTSIDEYCDVHFIIFIYVDKFLPRVVELALTSGDRQTKVRRALLSYERVASAERRGIYCCCSVMHQYDTVEKVLPVPYGA